MITIHRSLLAAASLMLAAPASDAATLLNMTFDNGGNNIDETTGWDGTTATGGSLAAGMSVTSGMRIYGDFTAQNGADVFHVDNWHTTNSATTRVGLSVAALGFNSFNLGDGTGVFSTRIHQHPTNAPDMFSSVELRINGTSVGSQTYSPAGGVQTLTWNLGLDPSLNGLTAATFDLYFPGSVNPTNNNHGPEWALGDSAFLQVSGTMVPEPSRALLLLTGLTLVGARRRRVA